MKFRERYLRKMIRIKEVKSERCEINYSRKWILELALVGIHLMSHEPITLYFCEIVLIYKYGIQI